MKALAELIKANPKEALFLVLLGAVSSWVVIITMDVWDTHADVARLEVRAEKVEDNYAELLALRGRVRAVEIEMARVTGRGD